MMEPLLKSENMAGDLTDHALLALNSSKGEERGLGMGKWLPPPPPSAQASQATSRPGSTSSLGSISQPEYQPLTSISPESSLASGKSLQFCRICHEGDMSNCSGRSPISTASTTSTSPNGSNRSGSRREALIAPCRCTGSVGMVHLSCLEHWLTTSNTDKCELCNFVYKTKKLPRSWTEFLTDPENQFNVRNMIADLVCFFLLTPLLVVSTYLCAIGAHQYYLRERWEAVGLVTLSIFLLMVYFTWCQVTLKYHAGVWRTWARTHQRVTITFGDGSTGQYQRRRPESNNNISPLFPEV